MQHGGHDCQYEIEQSEINRYVMVGPKTSLFIQLVAAASVGGAIGFYIQHKVWSIEKVHRQSMQYFNRL